MYIIYIYIYCIYVLYEDIYFFKYTFTWGIRYTEVSPKTMMKGKSKQPTYPPQI